MIYRIHFFIHRGRFNRNLPIKLIARHYPTRYILRSSTFSLRTKNRRCLCNLCSNFSL